jgi:hypothetical protein
LCRVSVREQKGQKRKKERFELGEKKQQRANILKDREEKEATETQASVTSE